jgi:cobalt/nickel transport protein
MGKQIRSNKYEELKIIHISGNVDSSTHVNRGFSIFDSVSGSFPMLKFVSLVVFGLAISLGQAYAHFQMIIPSDDMVAQGESRNLKMDLLFWHPFENKGMHMAKPVQFGVLQNGKKSDLLSSLKKVKMGDADGKAFDMFKARYSMRKPGDHIFYVEPQPYWEPSEDAFIIHYTKVIVNGFGLEEGWDEEVGLKTEIVPLTRPYGLWAGNVFQGIVKVKGKSVPYAEVEVEFYNPDGSKKAAGDPMITQVIKADKNGVFTYAMPFKGWWGFAALNEDDKKMKHDGKPKSVEIGAVLWVKTH